MVNRGLSHVKEDKLERLLLEKKRLISLLIQAEKFDRAESEIKSILKTDDEASTLLAELYYKRAAVSKMKMRNQIGYIGFLMSMRVILFTTVLTDACRTL